MTTHVCIHGHFYQPPRENPWLNKIEPQPAAAPFRDWNERIAAECYGPNAAVPIETGVDGGWQLFNNYTRISFNFGPTLLSWMERKKPDIYRAVLEADRSGRERFSGHGPAIAQSYNHMIMPLASSRDKYTQLAWGIRDFVHRFGRNPEGLWLPETAVDIETMEFMAKLGIRFTILAPHQVQSWKLVGEDSWNIPEGEGFARGEGVDTSLPYLVKLPGGGELSVFFYDPGLSCAVSFGGLLSDDRRFLEELTIGTAVGSTGPGPGLRHMAADGETFGHHFKGGEKTLARALNVLDSSDEVELTVYGEFLDRFPPLREVSIEENTSWSCPHGVERWRSDCGCSGGRMEGASQAWRTPLREALDRLRDSAIDVFEREASVLLHDPWQARNAFIDVILDPSEDIISGFLTDHVLPGVKIDTTSWALPLLEMQRNAMLMYTSCGLFFDDPGDIETIQILQYAGRVVQLAKACGGVDLEGEFLSALAGVKSGYPELVDGRRIYEQYVRPNIERFPEREY